MRLKNFTEFVLKLLNDNRGNLSLSGGAAGGEPSGNAGGNSGLPGGLPPGAQTSTPSEFEGVEFPANLEDDIKFDPSVKPFISEDKKLNYANLIKSYVHAQRKMGAKGVVVPGKHSTDEDWKNFYNSIRPSELEKYEVNVKPLDGQKINKEFFDEFKKTSHELGLLPKQAETIFNWMNNKEHTVAKAMTEAQQAEYDKEVQGLKSEWADGFDRELNIAKRAFKEFADESTIEYLQKTGLDQNVSLIKLFNKIGKGLLTEGQFKEEAKGGFGYTREQADRKYKDILADFKGPYYDVSHPNHNAVVEEVNKLIRVAEGY